MVFVENYPCNKCFLRLGKGEQLLLWAPREVDRCLYNGVTQFHEASMMLCD